MSTRNVQYIIELRDRFTKNIKGVNSSVNSLNKNATQVSRTLNTLGITFGAIGAIQLGKSIIKLGMDMEQTEVAFTTLLKSGDKAKELLGDLKKFAASTPFQLPEVLEASKQLLAYGFAQEDIIDTTRMLGDVAAGLKIPLGDMNYLFGTLKAQGRVMAIDIRQFAMRGIPIYSELAKVLGVTQNEVNELVSAGKVGFSDVEQVFKNLTSSGGQFYNLMEEQSKTVGGQLSNLKDSLGLIGITLGKSFLPQIGKIIQKGHALSSWVENNTDTIKRMVDIVLKITKLFIYFKGAIIAMQVATRVATVANNLFRFSIIAYNRGVTSAIKLTKTFNATMKANVFGAVAAGVAILIQKLVNLRNETKKTDDLFQSLGVNRETVEEIGRLADKMSTDISKFSTNELRAAAQHYQDIFDNMKGGVKHFEAIRDEFTGFEIMPAVTMDLDAMKEAVRKQVDFINSYLEREGLKPVMGNDTTVESRKTEITSRTPKVINININKLIETQEINTETLTEGTPKIKQLITQAILEAINDTQINYKAS